VSSALERLNVLLSEEAEARLLSCCGSREWARRLAEERPFATAEALAEAADRIWRSLSKEEWREAFAAHPRIGDVVGTGPTDLHPPNSVAGTGPAGLHPPPNSEQQKRGLSPFWSREEQAGAKGASAELLASLADANREYEERFGHIFIVCASGKSAAEMLAEALARLHNDAQTELAIAAEEQRKITRLRLAKLLEAEEA
jgi:OHCU decarboxylase